MIWNEVLLVLRCCWWSETTDKVKCMRNGTMKDRLHWRGIVGHKRKSGCLFSAKNLPLLCFEWCQSKTWIKGGEEGIANHLCYNIETRRFQQGLALIRIKWLHWDKCQESVEGESCEGDSQLIFAIELLCLSSLCKKNW